MRHATLYRKWRPRRMDQVVGQEPVIRTLRRAIETDRVAHAYLFSGPRGTGKTSTAKVLAMGLNCESGPTPEPDGTCESCRAIINNSSLDVVEMDAASNRGIDEIRDLRDRVNLAPVGGRMKVYIIDEVHMLTAEAFNALLKMLEEPPEHVVFVLATTEKHRVLPTIISRCQSFDFRRPSIETLAGKLGEIAKAEGIGVEPAALTVIAREGRGSFRDAEGLLDQLSSFSEGEITTSMVRELLGSVGPGILVETTYALHERRASDALRIVDRLSNEGRDLGQFVSELLSHLRNVMLLPDARGVALAGVGAEERPPLEEQANAVPTAEVVRLVEALGDALGRIRRGGDPKLELELTFLKLARDYTEPPWGNLVGRLEALERAVQNGGATPRNAASGNPTSGGATANAAGGAGGTPPPEPAAETERLETERLKTDGQGTERAAEEAADEAAAELAAAAEPQEPEPLEPEPQEPEPQEPGADEPEEAVRAVVDVAGQWTGIIDELKRRKQALTAAVYGEARVEGFDGDVLRLVFPGEQGFYVNMAKDRKHADVLTEVLEERVGSRPRLEVRSGGDDPGEDEPGGGGPAPAGPAPAGGAAHETASPEAVPSWAEPSGAEPPEMEPPEVAPPPVSDEPPGERDDGYGGAVAFGTGPGTSPGTSPGSGTDLGPREYSGAGGADGTIRREAEVFEMARGLGLFDQNEGG